MGHDVLDNRDALLLDAVHKILPTAEAAHFAIGFLFFSGLEALGAGLNDLPRARLLVGNALSRHTAEQLVEAHRHAEPAERALERDAYADRNERIAATARQARETVALGDQTDARESFLRRLHDRLAAGQMEVRVYVRERLHAKAYIFDYRAGRGFEEGIAIVGSSNLSLAGLRTNTELNIVVHGNENHRALRAWFDRLWDEAEPFAEHLLDELRRSWALAVSSPYDVYMKTLFTLIHDRLEPHETRPAVEDDELLRRLADFQRVAVEQAITKIRNHGGCFVADVVGLGKSFVGAAIVQHFEREERARPLIICPKSLVYMWETYNERFRLNARVLSMSELRAPVEEDHVLLDDPRFRDRDFVLIDESHHFRHHTTQRHEVLRRFVETGSRRVCLLTATPRNSSAWDIYHQMKLFHPEDRTAIPIDPPDLREFFRGVERRERDLPDLLSHVLIRRTRRHVLRWYGVAEDTGRPLRELDDDACATYLRGEKRAFVEVGGRQQFFPKRMMRASRYEIDKTYRGDLYPRLRAFLGRAADPSGDVPRRRRGASREGASLTYARFGVWHYVKPEFQTRAPYAELQRAGANLRGLVRILLFKRLESSVHAFRETVRRMVESHEVFLAALDRGVVPRGDGAAVVDEEAGASPGDASAPGEAGQQIADFDAERLRADIAADRDVLAAMGELVRDIGAKDDAKLQALVKLVGEMPSKSGKLLVFTQFADTARYIGEHVACARKQADVEVVYGTDRNKAKIAARFAPKANPELAEAVREPEINVLIATDVMGEGLNLQDCDAVVNYDLHWNPVRLIQRIGRIDRIGSEHATITGFNFLPELGLERQLGLEEILRRRIGEIHETIGEDGVVLEDGERLNERAMYAAFDETALARVESEEEPGGLVDLDEAEEFFRTLRDRDPAEFKRISELRDGIRSARQSGGRETFAFLAKGNYRELMLLDEHGAVKTRSHAAVLRAIAAKPDTPSLPLPAGHNARITALRAEFARRATKREAARAHVPLDPAQRWVIQEIARLFGVESDPAARDQLERLRRSLSTTLPSAVLRQLRALRKRGARADLRSALLELQARERLEESPAGDPTDESSVARIICSEALQG